MTIIKPVTRLEFLINKIREYGMEPIIQVSYNPICPTFTSPSGVTSLGGRSIGDQATVAANLVKAFNDPLTGTYSLNPIQYWSISNEPDLDNHTCTNTAAQGGFSYSNAINTSATSDATLIAEYIKEFSIQMKHQDPTIYIMGPELASFGNDGTTNGSTYWNTSHRIMKDLLTPSNSACITGNIPVNSNYPNGIGKPYVDVFTFHHYAIPQFNNSAGDIIDEPAISDKGLAKTLSKSGGNFNGLTQLLSLSRSATNCSIACTEFNIDVKHTQHNESTANGYAAMINGWDNRSFLGGQWLCENFAEAIKMTNQNNIPWVNMLNLWSAREGDCTNGLGYITSCGTPSSSATFSNAKRPMYHHYEMMANNFKGTFYSSTLTLNQTGANEIKAWPHREPIESRC